MAAGDIFRRLEQAERRIRGRLDQLDQYTDRVTLNVEMNRQTQDRINFARGLNAVDLTDDNPFCEQRLNVPGAGKTNFGVGDLGGESSSDGGSQSSPIDTSAPTYSRGNIPDLLFSTETIEIPIQSALREKIVMNPGTFFRNPESLYEEWSHMTTGETHRRFSADRAYGLFRNREPEFGIDTFRIASGKYWFYKDNKFEDIYHPSSTNDSTRTGSHHNIVFKEDLSSWSPPQNQDSRLTLNEKFTVEVSNYALLHYELGHKIDGEEIRPESMDPTIKSAYSIVHYGLETDFIKEFLLDKTDEYPSEYKYSRPVIELNKYFFDFVHSTEMPYSKREYGKLQYGRYNKIEVNVISNFVAPESRRAENDISCMYTVYQKMQDEQENLNIFDWRSVQTKEDIKYKFFTSKNVKHFKAASDALKHNYPQYVEFSIPTPQASKFATMLSDTGMSKHIANLLITESEDYKKVYRCIEVLDEMKLSQSEDQQIVEISPTGLNDRSFSSDSPIAFYDIEGYLKSLTREDLKNLNLDYFPLKIEGETNMNMSSLWDLINKSIFLSFLQQEGNRNRSRKYSQIMAGQKAYSETVAYKIEKYRATDDGRVEEDILQCFIVFDSDEIEKLKFCDTQVTYDQTYYYRVFAINLVIGSRYMYKLLSEENVWRSSFGPTESRVQRFDPSNISVTENIPGLNGLPAIDAERSNNPLLNLQAETSYSEMDVQSYNIAVENTPYPVLCKVPYYEKVVKIKDHPPVFPDVSFIPYNGLKDKIGIIINNNPGEYILSPVKILDSDDEKITRMRLRSNLEDPSKVFYSGDSTPSYFQIFRLEEPPTDYRDFKNALFKSLRHNMVPNFFEKYVSSESISDKVLGKGLIEPHDLEPNKDYYYCFRAVDTAGISNPTEVYKVKNIYDGDGIYLRTEVFDMEKEPPKKKESFTRFLQISPSREQLSVDFLSEDQKQDPSFNIREVYNSVPEEINLGTSNKKIWDKFYKLRIRSKKTGKVFDINFKFDYKTNTYTYEDFGLEPPPPPPPPRPGTTSGIPYASPMNRAAEAIMRMSENPSFVNFRFFNSYDRFAEIASGQTRRDPSLMDRSTGYDS